MIKNSVWGLGASFTALVMFAAGASAQLAPAQPKAPAAAPGAQPAPAPAKAATPATPAPVKKVVAAASACKGLDQAGCGAKAAECGWVVPTKVDAKTGKADAPYCRKVAGVAKKAADAKAAAAAKPAAPAPAAAPAKAPAAAAPAATPKKTP